MKLKKTIIILEIIALISTLIIVLITLKEGLSLIDLSLNLYYYLLQVFTIVLALIDGARKVKD
ncbi:hypothetical protein HYX13_02115 [Candidatus Woesearchaeota archaeon]|nr:hypothetical protein [Candidatus Woesearchaeota archaeon]